MKESDELPVGRLIQTHLIVIIKQGGGSVHVLCWKMYCTVNRIKLHPLKSMDEDFEAVYFKQFIYTLKHLGNCVYELF